MGCGVLFYLFTSTDIATNKVLGYAIMISPLWLPYVLFYIWFGTWMHYIQAIFTYAQGRVSLEIRLPQEVLKSPAAMEMVLIQLYQTASADNLVQTYWDGKCPSTTSLEIISTGGQVRFIVNCARKKMKNLVEAQMYAHYPGIEVRELPFDYTAAIPWDPSRFQVFSIHFGLKKPDPYPLKTYIDFGLDRDPKEEFKIDPLNSMLEVLGSIGPKEHIWYQFLISVHREENFKTGSLSSSPDWKDDIKKTINEIANRDPKKKTSAEGIEGVVQLTDGEKDLIKAMERSLSKYPFNVKLRAMYVAENDSFLPGERIGNIITALAAFNDLNRNSFGIKWRTDVNWPWWQDPKGKKRLAWKQSELEEYKLRSWTSRTTSDNGAIMTTEEIATFFHLPGKVANTPGIVRIPSTRGSAPSNLPT